MQTVIFHQQAAMRGFFVFKEAMLVRACAFSDIFGEKAVTSFLTLKESQRNPLIPLHPHFRLRQPAEHQADNPGVDLGLPDLVTFDG